MNDNSNSYQNTDDGDNQMFKPSEEVQAESKDDDDESNEYDLAQSTRAKPKDVKTLILSPAATSSITGPYASSHLQTQQNLSVERLSDRNSELRATNSSKLSEEE